MQTGYHGCKSFAGKILPASDCAPRILSHFPANLMIPIDQGGGGIPAFPQRNAPTNRWGLAQPFALPNNFEGAPSLSLRLLERQGGAFDFPYGDPTARSESKAADESVRPTRTTPSPRDQNPRPVSPKDGETRTGHPAECSVTISKSTGRKCPPCTDKPATELHVVPFYESFFSQESYSCVA
jgi:hypothetical protein